MLHKALQIVLGPHATQKGSNLTAERLRFDFANPTKLTPEEIKALYHLRWKEEISFRTLKYTTNLSAVHARKRSSILQEIWARAILYNFSFIIIRELAKRKEKKKQYILFAMC